MSRLFIPTISARAFRQLTVLGLVALVPISAAAATVRGVVNDPDGRPVPFARVILSGPIGAAGVAVTDGRGVFRIDQLPAGRYELRVSVEGLRADPLTFDLAADEERVEMVALALSAVTESLVVSAAQVDVPLSVAAGSVTVIGDELLRARQIENVADALRFVPGMTVARNGGRGAITSIFPRGGESDFTLVLVDGVRVNAFGGGLDLSTLPRAGIDRVEIVRGPQSALFGSDAIGGVVQIVSGHGGPARVSGIVEGGGLGTTRVSAMTAASHGAWSWGAAADRLASDGFTGIAPATGERVSNDDYRSREASASIGWRTQRGTEIRADSRLFSDERGFPGPFGSNPTGSYTAVDRISRGIVDGRQVGVKLTHPWLSSNRARQRAQIAVFDLDGEFTSPYDVSESESRRLSARAQTDIIMRQDASASFGVEYQRERARSTYIVGESAPIPIRRHVIGYFAEARYQGGQRLLVSSGLRVEQIHRDRLEGSPNGFPPRPPFDADSVVSPNPKIGVTYFLRPPRGDARWTRVRASAATGIRPPDAFEIAFTDNPGLKPERSRSFDVGVAQALARGAVVLEGTAFVNRYDDLIVAVGGATDASRFQTDNISNARARGIELSAAARTKAGFDARASYTYLDTEILAVDGTTGAAPLPFKVGDALLRRPRHQGAIDLGFVRGRASAFAQAIMRGEQLDVEPTLGTSGGLFFNPGYIVVHAGVGLRVTTAIEVYARAINLFDRRYEEALGFPALGRTGIVGVRVAARR